MPVKAKRRRKKKHHASAAYAVALNKKHRKKKRRRSCRKKPRLRPQTTHPAPPVPSDGGNPAPGPAPPVPPPPAPPGLKTISSPIGVYQGAFGHLQAERLLFRAGFGPRPGDIERLVALGFEGAVLSLTRPSGTAPTVDGGPLAPIPAPAARA